MLNRFTTALLPAAVCAATLLAGLPSQAAATQASIQPTCEYALSATTAPAKALLACSNENTLRVGADSVGPWD